MSLTLPAVRKGEGPGKGSAGIRRFGPQVQPCAARGATFFINRIPVHPCLLGAQLSSVARFIIAAAALASIRAARAKFVDTCWKIQVKFARTAKSVDRKYFL